MRLVRLVAAILLIALFTGCRDRLSSEEARELLNKSSMIEPMRSPVFVPDGETNTTVLRDEYFQKAQAFGWVSCWDRKGELQCVLTGNAKELSSGWKRSSGRYGSGWEVPVYSFQVIRVDVKRQDDRMAEALFNGKWEVNETGRKFGVWPRAEGLTWIATFEKKDDGAWQVVDVIDTAKLIRIR
ncbi:MAG: hypothetical protein ACYC7A_11485 [Thermoanaerobaculia bacterium]